MRPEWKAFWKKTAQNSRAVVWGFGIALLFFLSNLPYTKPENYLHCFLIAMAWGLFMSFGPWFSYMIFWAVQTRIQVRTGKMATLNLLGHFVIATPGMFLGIWLSMYCESQFTGVAMDSKSFGQTLLTSFFIMTMFIMWYSFKNAREENLKLQAANSESKYNVLKTQMRPHFLFNSLNSLAELIEQDPARASQMSQKLSDLYREILQSSAGKTNSLDRELSIVEKYLALEKIRFGDRLQVALARPENAEHVMLPSLVLQTLVENAVKHGISKSLDGGKISVHVTSKGEDHEIAVTNTASIAPVFEEGRGTGLVNTRNRLDLIFGDRHGFHFLHDNGETRVQFSVPGAGA